MSDSATPSDDSVARRILGLVAELTGYPQDMLDLDLDMEADLGIDTVKQAEMFAAIREEWDIPRDDNLQLRDFPTLAHTIQFVYDRRPDMSTGEASEPPRDEAEAESARSEPVQGDVPRRVPVAIPRPALDLCQDTPIGSLRGTPSRGDA